MRIPNRVARLCRLLRFISSSRAVAAQCRTAGELWEKTLTPAPRTTGYVKQLRSRLPEVLTARERLTARKQKSR